MQNLNFLETELLDIIFQGKNKLYGAYALRKNYSKRMHKALLITTTLLISLFTVLTIIPAKVGPIEIPIEIPDGPVINIVDVILPKQDPIKAGSIIKTNPAETAPIEIVDNSRPIEKPIDKPLVHHSTTSAQTNGETGTTTKSGDGGTGAMTSTTSTSPTNGTATTTATSTAKVIDYAEVMPEFPGGEEAMMQYLKTHINYPKLAMNTGVEGVVFVEFVVNKNGQISRVKVLNGLGAGCDQEAARVIKSMPVWKPGIQNGNKVNVAYVIPVKFEL